MRDESKQLRKAIKGREVHQAGDNIVGLGDVLSKLMEDRISPQQAKFGSIKDVWGQLLPAELYQHCRIVGMSSGRLKVLVDSPSYMYELQLLSCELLGELARRCPRARIKEIKLAVG